MRTRSPRWSALTTVHAASPRNGPSMLNLFQSPKKAQPKAKVEPLVIQPDYRVAAGFFLGACMGQGAG